MLVEISEQVRVRIVGRQIGRCSGRSELGRLCGRQQVMWNVLIVSDAPAARLLMCSGRRRSRQVLMKCRLLAVMMVTSGCSWRMSTKLVMMLVLVL